MLMLTMMLVMMPTMTMTTAMTTMMLTNGHHLRMAWAQTSANGMGLCVSVQDEKERGDRTPSTGLECRSGRG